MCGTPRVSHNPPKNDRWKPYDDVRFVLIRNVGRLKPSRGLVLEWRKSGRHWEAYVVWHDATGQPVVKIDWLPADRLIPVQVDPNARTS
jgi:hypothetical protein